MLLYVLENHFVGVTRRKRGDPFNGHGENLFALWDLGQKAMLGNQIVERFLSSHLGNVLKCMLLRDVPTDYTRQYIITIP